MSAYYPYILAAHIIFVITWFAALFYIVRLYIYHTEALAKQEPERSILANQFIVMESRLMQIIGTPSMILVVITGTTLLCINSIFLQESWMQWKLAFVACVVIYHFYCLHLQRALKTGNAKLTSIQLRMYNELATILLVGIVFLVMLKNLLDMAYGLIGLAVLSIVMLVAIRLYKRSRENKNAD